MTDYKSLNDLVQKPISGGWGDGEGSVNVLRTTNFTNIGEIDFSEVVKRNISEKKVTEKKLLKDDIVIEKSGGSPSQPVGRVVFFNQEGEYLCNNFTSILRPIKTRVFPKYLHYILFCNHKYGVVRKYQNKTTGIINLKLANYLAETKIPLPSLAEQQKIAAILDAADSLRQKDQQLVERYTALSQSLFLEMFGDPLSNPKNWKLSTLSSLVNAVIDCPHTTPRWIESGKVAIRTSNLREGGWIWDDKRYVSEQEYHERSARAYVKSGDIILSREGTVGVAAIVSSDMEICLGQRLVQIQPNLQLANNHFLLNLILYELAPERFEKYENDNSTNHITKPIRRTYPTH